MCLIKRVIILYGINVDSGEKKCLVENFKRKMLGIRRFEIF